MDLQLPVSLPVRARQPETQKEVLVAQLEMMRGQIDLILESLKETK